jgi:hypothetical protein
VKTFVLGAMIVGCAASHQEIRGTARDAKLGAAVVRADRSVVYCIGIERWPAELEGHDVVVTGRLEQTDEFTAGSGEAGTNGPVWVLRDCKFSSPVR